MNPSWWANRIRVTLRTRIAKSAKIPGNGQTRTANREANCFGDFIVAERMFPGENQQVAMNRRSHHRFGYSGYSATVTRPTDTNALLHFPQQLALASFARPLNM